MLEQAREEAERIRRAARQAEDVREAERLAEKDAQWATQRPKEVEQEHMSELWWDLRRQGLAEAERRKQVAEAERRHKEEAAEADKRWVAEWAAAKPAAIAAATLAAAGGNVETTDVVGGLCSGCRRTSATGGRTGATGSTTSGTGRIDCNDGRPSRPQCSAPVEKVSLGSGDRW